ncbi:MAG: glycoside hydrolase family 3 C-terminal domain-containing protein [Bacilli bacterium]|nr:glycoside hydrolase family 3 C-terminal domain-containing protein [Bacilli bacterium]
MKKKLLIPVFLGALALPLALQQGAQGMEAQMFGEANNKNDYVAYASKIGAQIADEGFVLLKNDGFLPMNTEGAKVSITSKGSANFVRGGTGSGGGNVDSSVKSYSIQSSLEEVGCQINPTLVSFYSNSSKSGSGRSDANPNKWDGVNYSTIGETPMSSYSATELNSMDEYNDAIIFLITRQGSEGCDLKTCDARDSTSDPVSDRHALELSNNEEALFEEVKKHTDHVIVVVNSSNVFECGRFEDDDKVSAVLWIGNPGDVGPGALGRIISGQVNPSGHTVDTWARDFSKDPTWQNFADNAQTNKTTDASGNPTYAAQDTMFNADGTPVMCFGSDKSYNDHSKPNWADEKNKVVKGGLNGVRPSAYVSYEEGIYYDYRYYETKYDDMKANNESAADDWYEGESGVVYPFGYGLSYTTFTQEVVSTNLPSKALTNPDTKVEVKVKVTNTGDVAGKEVAQLYFRAPYEAGGIEKASKVLCAFAKTDILEPGESQELDLEFYLQDVANYDFTDANGNGFMGYELDGGNYELVLGKNAHEELDQIEFQIRKSGFKYSIDRYTGNTVENRFTNNGFFSSLPGEDDIEFTQMSRANFEESFPTHPTLEDRTLGENSRVEEFYTHEFTLADIDVETTYEYMPVKAYKTKEDIEALGWTQAADTSGEVTIKLTDLLNTDMDDPIWKDFMDQMTYSEMLSFVSGGGTHNPAISRFAKESTGDSDGPQRFKIMWWTSAPITAATYNVELARKQGECVGMEGKIQGTQGWAGPAVNIHRSPFGGRNFEYYSADPFLTGRIAGRVVSGATDRGVYCFFKHFAVNDQEKGREGVSAFVNEQALREIYLKAFQLPIQEGKALGIMSSYNRLGLMETAASYPLLTEVLRNEWGFKGSIISDMTHHSNSSHNRNCYENINNRLLAGCNQQLDGSSFASDMNATWDAELGCPTFKHEGDIYESYSWWYAVRTMAQQCIWMNARSSKYVSSFTSPLEGLVISGANEMNQYVVRSGEDIDIEISLPDEYKEQTISSAEMSIDPFTPLPEGLTFADNHITGKVEGVANKSIHVLVDMNLGDGTTATAGNSFELIVLANTPDDGKKEESKKGCFGSATALSSMFITLMAAGVGTLLLKRRKED